LAEFDGLRQPNPYGELPLVDADSTLVVGGLDERSEHMEAFRGDDNHYAMVYLLIGQTIELNITFLKAKQIN